MPSPLENLVDKFVANEQFVWVKLNANSLIVTISIDDKNVLIVVTKVALSPVNYKVAVSVNGVSLANMDTGIEHLTEKIDTHFISRISQIETETNKQIDLLGTIL